VKKVWLLGLTALGETSRVIAFSTDKGAFVVILDSWGVGRIQTISDYLGRGKLAAFLDKTIRLQLDL
jgi:hypothetical protein